MQIIKRLVAVLVFVLAAGVCPGQTKTEPAPTKAVDREVKSLLRKDLLQIRKQEAAPPKRNIFAPRAGFSLPGEVVRRGGRRPAVDYQAADELMAGDETADAPPVVSVNLRYIGFIESPGRLVAMINFEGRAAAVVEGDIVGEGIRIGKITKQQIEVIMPDSSTRTFSREGE